MTNNNIEHNILENAMKLFETGKQQYGKDNAFAEKCIKMSLDNLNKIKDNDMIECKQLIQTTEAECHKLLTKQNINIFSLINMNDINTIKNLSYINFREINDKGNTILHHAIDIGDTWIIKTLLKKGGQIDSVNGNGNTLLEYACLKKDPNIINFLILHGADMKKHLFFRKGNDKIYLNKSDIDMAILLKIVISKSQKISDAKSDINKFKFLEKYFNMTELIGLDKYTIVDLIKGLDIMFNEKESFNTFKKIIIEELDVYNIGVNKCSYNKIDIILSNMVPFINYPFNLSCIFLIKNEIKYIIYNILNNNKKEFKNILLLKLFETYIQTNLFQEDYIGIIIFNILSKIKL